MSTPAERLRRYERREQLRSQLAHWERVIEQMQTHRGAEHWVPAWRLTMERKIKAARRELHELHRPSSPPKRARRP